MAAKTGLPSPAKRGGKKGKNSLALATKAEVASAQAITLPPPRIDLHRDGLTIRDAAFFYDPASEQGRLFLTRVFSVEEVEAVEIDRGKGVGRLRYSPSVNIAGILRKLQRVVMLPVQRAGAGNGHPAGSLDANSLFLETPAALPIRVTRVGAHLSTWQVRNISRERVRLTHPILRNRKDVAYRLEEELTAVQGVREFKTSVFSSSIVVSFNHRKLDVPRLLRHLEHCWPRLINGLQGPPPAARFFAAFSMLTLSFVGQYFVPALTPFVLLGVAAYGFANVVSAFKLLARGKVGLPTLYTGTLTFTVLSGMPFAATLMATMMQLWPRWAYRVLIRSERRLFAAHRQRATWARRVLDDGQEVEINIDFLKIGDLISVEEGEVFPVDGVVTSGLAAVDEEVLTGRAGALDKAPGDIVYAATFVKAGGVTVRVSKVGGDTLAGFIGEQLPHGYFTRLPSLAEAEDIATRMVAPALALSGLNLLITGSVLPSQATIRPDYATGPRLSAQLGTLHDLSDALRRGILFRDPAALSRLPATDIYVFDDTPAIERRRLAVGEVIVAKGVPFKEVLSYAISAFPAYQNDRARALMDHCFKQGAPLLEITERSRRAGIISYRDPKHRLVEVVTPAYLEAEGIRAPASVAAAVAASPTAWAERGNGSRKKAIPHPEPQVRPLWIVRDGVVLGVVTFERNGDLEGVGNIATLRARNAQALFVHISRKPQAEAEAIANRIGITTVFGGLDTEGKVEILKRLGRRTMWIGDGSAPESVPCIEASTISISLAGAATVPIDAANIVLLQPSLRGLVPLRRIGRRHRAMLKDGYRSVFAANLFCVVGAFFGGFNTLSVAIASNFATGYVYSFHRRHLNDLIARMEAKMAKDMPEETEDHDPKEGTSDEGAHEVEAHEDYSEHDLDAPVPDERPM